MCEAGAIKALVDSNTVLLLLLLVVVVVVAAASAVSADVVGLAALVVAGRQDSSGRSNSKAPRPCRQKDAYMPWLLPARCARDAKDPLLRAEETVT